VAGPLTTGVLDPDAHQGMHGENLVRAVVAAAGLEISRPEPAYGKDYYIGFPGPRQTIKTPKILVSVKSWAAPVLSADHCWHYPLKGANYNFLARSTDLRPYLFLAVVPADANDYSSASHTGLELRTAVYWLSFEGIAPDAGLADDSTRTVNIPHVQLITDATLIALIEGRDDDAVVLP